MMFHAVNAGMFRASHNFQVLDSVVFLLTIDVMDYFMALKFSAKFIFHDFSVAELAGLPAMRDEEIPLGMV